MFPIGFFLVAAGLWLADSAYHGRPPLTTLEDILRDPKNMRATLDGANKTVSTSSALSAFGLFNGVLGVTPTGATGLAGPIVAFAEAQIGKPYKLGFAGPNAYDCSGLCYAAYASVGIKIPRVTATQIVGGRHVARKDLQPGDLIFPYPGHVFLYAGGGMAVEAPHTGTTVHMTNIYSFFTARRYLAPTAPVKRHKPGPQVP